MRNLIWRQFVQTVVTDRCSSLNMLSAVSPKGEICFMLHDGTVIDAVFQTFLHRLMAGATYMVFVVVDGHSVHKCILVCQYIKSQARHSFSCSSCRRTRRSSTRTSRSGACHATRKKIVHRIQKSNKKTGAICITTNPKVAKTGRIVL